MHLIQDLLDMMQLRGSAYVGKNLTAPWTVLVDEQEPFARFHLVLAGETWVETVKTGEAVYLKAGDLAIVPQGGAHLYYDTPGQAPSEPRLMPAPNKAPRFARLDTENPQTHIFCGYFQLSRSTPVAIVSRLPDMIVLRRNMGAAAKNVDMITQLIAQEVAGPHTPPLAILNRLTEVLCLYAMQTWLDEALPDDERLQALADPRTKSVLDAIHADPMREWSVDALARIYGQSRTAFAVQFRDALGQGPMAYVRWWRIRLACKMLEETELPIDEIAYMSGYADGNAFSRAFKREVGSSPGGFRRAVRR